MRRLAGLLVLALAPFLANQETLYRDLLGK